MRLSILIAIAVFALTHTVTAQDSGKEITNSIGMKLVLIPAGTFQMGSPPSEEGSLDDERQHVVAISEDYYLGVFEVTQSQYRQVMGTNPSNFQAGKLVERHPQTGRVVKEVNSSNHPVESVSWTEAAEFCVRLSDLREERETRRVYRLPTEAEWEYACRATSKTAYSFADNRRDLESHAWFGNNSGVKKLDADYFKVLALDGDKLNRTWESARCATHPVGEKKPNAWGLYDMHGNVEEWCADWKGSYPRRMVIDPMGPKGGTHRVVRGGGWSSSGIKCRSASRDGSSPWGQFINTGFRVALTVPSNEK
jgi:formylglycine-generating enzyme required for sulfatase activity